MGSRKKRGLLLQLQTQNILLSMTALYGPLHCWKFKKIHDAWKDLEKTQKMGSIWASYLKLFRNGGQLKLRYQK